jgi:5-methylcytosine-specific restriction enzyme A
MRLCSTPGCSVRVASGHCPDHRRRAWQRTDAPARVRGRKLQTLRTELFARHPFCAICHALLDPHGWHRDHTVALAYGGRDDDSNVRALCVTCHAAKSRAESQRRGPNATAIRASEPVSPLRAELVRGRRWG